MSTGDKNNKGGRPLFLEKIIKKLRGDVTKQISLVTIRDEEGRIGDIRMIESKDAIREMTEIVRVLIVKGAELANLNKDKNYKGEQLTTKEKNSIKYINGQIAKSEAIELIRIKHYKKGKPKAIYTNRTLFKIKDLMNQKERK